MTMSKTEIDRALRELRLPGITATLETRRQSEKMPDDHGNS